VHHRVDQDSRWLQTALRGANNLLSKGFACPLNPEERVVILFCKDASENMKSRAPIELPVNINE
jgi:hypothetical protein